MDNSLQLRLRFDQGGDEEVEDECEGDAVEVFQFFITDSLQELEEDSRILSEPSETEGEEEDATHQHHLLQHSWKSLDGMGIKMTSESND